MMKYLAKFLLIIMAVGLVSSCEDDFLDQKPTQKISVKGMSEAGKFNPDIFDGQVSGLYTLMYADGTGGSTDERLYHDDFGQKGYDIFSDLLSGDMVLAGYNYGWYQSLAQYTATMDNTYSSNYRPWRYYYRIIFAANSIIKGLGGNEAVPEQKEQKYQLGQAKAMRAYSYLYLNYFYNEKIDDMAAKSVPLYTDPDQQGLPQSTVQEVWDQINNDLTSAITLLDGFQRTGEQVIDQDVAKGLLAYADVSTGKWTDAIKNADDLISMYNLIPLADACGGPSIPRDAYSYIDGQGADWIWGMDLTLDQGLDLVSWWGQVDVFTYSYACVGDAKTGDAGLVASIRSTDVRSGWWGDHPWYPIINCPINKFYDQQRSAMTQREITSDYVYMRVEEMYLIKAEAQAFSNDDNGARTTLKLLIEQRDTDPSYVDALSGTALKDEIYHQWRVEMWGEGKAYLAMKRFKATNTRQGHIDYNIAIPYDDPRLTFKIPHQEIQDNPNISE